VTDEGKRRADHEAREAREADLVANRLRELYENPIRGRFDLAHLKAIRSYIFQDLPEHEPGITRDDTEGWVKTRVLEGQSSGLTPERPRERGE
jgi:fido (protein-threonine AMPylation protein)